jgi:hypothetical protein
LPTPFCQIMKSTLPNCQVHFATSQLTNRYLLAIWLFCQIVKSISPFGLC